MENSESAGLAPNPLLQIDPDDNVGVLIQSLPARSSLQVGGREVLLSEDLALGHKIALRDIAAGEKILKYGCAIGSALCDIRAGDHVHLHNLQSDYLPTHTLEQGRKYEQ